MLHRLFTIEPIYGRVLTPVMGFKGKARTFVGPQRFFSFNMAIWARHAGLARPWWSSAVKCP